MTDQEKAGAIIVAAGSSQRMGGADKILAPLGEKPVLARVIDVFENCVSIHQIVVALSAPSLEAGQQMLSRYRWSKVTDFCPGGRRRQDSVAAGLRLLTGCHWVVIHDGARPLVTEDLIEGGLEAARETGAAVAAVPVTDTIKVSGDDGFIRETLPRHNLWAAQTPQVFLSDIIAKAYQQVTDDVTDDATLVERLGYRIKLYMGSYGNIKVTTPDDLALAGVLWQKRLSPGT